MEKPLNWAELLDRYSNEAACLERIKDLRFPSGIFCPKCKTFTDHYPLKRRKAYCCTICLHQVYPLKGTIFEKSTTPLTYWFYAIFLMTNTRCGVAAKTLQRELGISYNTALRMFRKIREAMYEDSGLLKGTVEVDETWVGGKGYFRGKDWWPGWKDRPKQIVVGFVQRGGVVKTQLIDSTDRYTLTKQVQANIDTSAWVITDAHQGYSRLDRQGYRHNSVNHTVQYVDGLNHDIHTQTIEGFWGLVKGGLRGVYRHVSFTHLPLYLNEFIFRYNHRHEQSRMFEILLRKSTCSNEN